MTVVDPKRFIVKNKPITYTRAFVELYNIRKSRQVHEIYEIIELEKMRTLTVENPRKLVANQIIEISSILHNAYLIPRDQDKFVFDVNNYIDWN